MKTYPKTLLCPVVTTVSVEVVPIVAIPEVVEKPVEVEVEVEEEVVDCPDVVVPKQREFPAL